MVALRKYELIEQKIEKFYKEEKTMDTILEMSKMIINDELDEEEMKEVIENIIDSEVVAFLFDREQVKACKTLMN